METGALELRRRLVSLALALGRVQSVVGIVRVRHRRPGARSTCQLQLSSRLRDHRLLPATVCRRGATTSLVSFQPPEDGYADAPSGTLGPDHGYFGLVRGASPLQLYWASDI